MSSLTDIYFHLNLQIQITYSFIDTFLSKNRKIYLDTRLFPDLELKSFKFAI